jgi:hypothetical protein
MPMHDWTKVDAGVYHVLHFYWIGAIDRVLRQRLPEGFYSMPEQHAGPFGPDVLTLTTQPLAGRDTVGGTATLPRPRTKVVQESAGDFYLSKQRIVAIRHVSDDRLVAVVEIVSRGNKDSNPKYRQFVKKAQALLEQKIHLLIVDPFAPPAKHPEGLHFDIVEDGFEEPYRLPATQPLLQVAYECDDNLRAYVEPFALGDRLANMPVYLEPDFFVEVPLEETYMAAWGEISPRWQTVVAG